MSLPAWWPRLSCVYCGIRLPDVRRGGGAGGGSRVPFPFTLACVKHADLPALDVRYYGA